MVEHGKEEGQTIGELTQEYLKRLMQPPLVLVEDGYIVFTETGESIDLGQIPDYRALVVWIDHFMTKNWITVEHLRQFIAVFQNYHDSNSNLTH